jgi:hypothetical protein
LKLQEAEEEEEKSDFLASSMKRHDRAGKPQTQKSKCWTSRHFVVLLSSVFFFFFFFWCVQQKPWPSERSAGHHTWASTVTLRLHFFARALIRLHKKFHLFFLLPFLPLSVYTNNVLDDFPNDPFKQTHAHHQVHVLFYSTFFFSPL